jgi:acetyl esterase/lipase
MKFPRNNSDKHIFIPIQRKRIKISAFFFTLSLLFNLFFTPVVNSQLSAQIFRYIHSVFSSLSSDTGIVYGTAPFLQSPYRLENNTVTDSLRMDIFWPADDTLSHRPAIIFAHSGAFYTGNRNHDDMLAFCDSLSRKGYVTATIDYRQGFELFSTNTPMHATRAVYRAFQDARAAIRFLRAHATQYGIDTTRIYFVGSSAGAFLALHLIYLDKPNEKPAEAGQLTYWDPLYGNQVAPDLGPFDVGDYLNVFGQPRAVVSLWGALQDTLLIEPDNTAAVFLIHGESDSVVPFHSGHPFSYPLFPEVFGSFTLFLRLQSLSLNNYQTYFVPGVGHEFYGTSNGMWTNGTGGNEYWDIILEKITRFFWQQHKPVADFTYVANGSTVYFTNTSSDTTLCLWDFGDGSSSTQVNPTHQFGSPGTYRVRLYTENSIQSWDTVSHRITITATSLEASNPVATRLRLTSFPNPFNASTRIQFFLNQPGEANISIYTISGQLIREFHFSWLSPGSHSVVWDGRNNRGQAVGSGIYLCRLQSRTGQTIGKLIVSR